MDAATAGQATFRISANMMTHEILTNTQMADADRQTIEAGTPGYTLMQRAGQAATDEILKHYNLRKALVLCGPGNNGGDGFVMARLLQKEGWDIEVACLVDPGALKGDAAKAAQGWDGAVLAFENVTIEESRLVVDAVFGTGFKGDMKEPVSSLFQQMTGPVVAVDIPSGVNGDTGQADPHTLNAELTVTFHRKKLGHALFPGAGFCGTVIAKDIGIMNDFEHEALENHPDLWRGALPHKRGDAHKYNYGHAVIYGAPELTGATRLAATACARVGAGLTTVLADSAVAHIYRTALPAHIMVRDDLNWDDERVSVKLHGPGGLPEGAAISTEKPLVLDADALSLMPDVFNENCVLTPHDGEFAQAFPDIKGSKVEKAKQAAAQTKAIVLLKGADTVIAHPDGQCVINTHSSPYLATAGSGDVLAGMITGFIGQGVPAFDAACMAAWIHGEAALRHGPGLVASDIEGQIPEIFKDLIE